MLLVYVSYIGIREYTAATSKKSVENPGMLLLKDNVQLLAELPVRKLPDIMTLSQERKRMPPMMWA